MSLDVTTSAEGIDVAGEVPSKEELIARAQAMVPKLRERALEAEENRRIPDANYEEMIAAGFARILKPTRLGGYGMTHEVSHEVIQTLGQGCGSTGWIANLVTGHPWQLGLFGLEAQEEIWNEFPDAFVATASPGGKCVLEEVDGGYRLTGRYKFSSGCDFADWFMLMKPTADCFDWMLLPRSEVEFVDDWYVSGLRGTGSKDLIVEDVFIPAHRVVAFDDVFNGTAPGGKLEGGVGNGNVPFVDAVAFGIPAAVIGMTQGLVDAFQKNFEGGKRSQLSGELQAERPTNQVKIAKAQADVDMALAVMRSRLVKMREASESGAPLDPIDRLAHHRDAGYVTKQMAQTAAELGVGAGASAIYYKNPVQRNVRDILAGSAHALIAWEDVAEPYGRAKWGVEAKPMLGS
jgi:3-hydroxy-9,10-secoandrosta-1,3,5(10)-triene-9,17-dione monooxygenase